MRRLLYIITLDGVISFNTRGLPVFEIQIYIHVCVCSIYANPLYNDDDNNIIILLIIIIIIIVILIVTPINNYQTH